MSRLAWQMHSLPAAAWHSRSLPTPPHPTSCFTGAAPPTPQVCADTFRAGAFDQLKQNATKAQVGAWAAPLAANRAAHS